ncbi:MAG: hypothetical protein GY710_22295 [Desulfobacteraceae bacterium]|nr:hypothetical protein [Desulfobacteraceae bacterium]
MIDSTTKKQAIAVQKGNQISIKIYSWKDLPILEEYLEDNKKSLQLSRLPIFT